MLVAELRGLHLAEMATRVDRGIGQLAMAAIEAAAPGPHREFEVARWARRIAAAADTTVAFCFDRDTDRAVIAAVFDLDNQIAALRGRPRGRTVVR